MSADDRRDVVDAPNAVRAEAERHRQASVRAVDELYQAIDGLLVAGGVEAIDPIAIQKLNTLGVKLYAGAKDAKAIADPVLGGEAVTATDASVFCSGLLHAVNLDLFELSLWRTWSSK